MGLSIASTGIALFRASAVLFICIYIIGSLYMWSLHVEGQHLICEINSWNSTDNSE